MVCRVLQESLSCYIKHFIKMIFSHPLNLSLLFGVINYFAVFEHICINIHEQYFNMLAKPSFSCCAACTLYISYVFYFVTMVTRQLKPLRNPFLELQIWGQGMIVHNFPPDNIQGQLRLLSTLPLLR